MSLPFSFWSSLPCAKSVKISRLQVWGFPISAKNADQFVPHHKLHQPMQLISIS
jgi:hypothetical protein